VIDAIISIRSRLLSTCISLRLAQFPRLTKDPAKTLARIKINPINDIMVIHAATELTGCLCQSG
jgi:hypothetical protein